MTIFASFVPNVPVSERNLVLMFDYAEFRHAVRRNPAQAHEILDVQDEHEARELLDKEFREADRLRQGY